jgi:hypothetical protein
MWGVWLYKKCSKFPREEERKVERAKAGGLMSTVSVKRKRQSGRVCSEAKINSAGTCKENGKHAHVWYETQL